MSAIILATTYLLFALGVYQYALRNGFKPETTLKQRIKVRARIAFVALTWPRSLAKQWMAPTRYEFF